MTLLFDAADWANRNVIDYQNRRKEDLFKAGFSATVPAYRHGDGTVPQTKAWISELSFFFQNKMNLKVPLKWHHVSPWGTFFLIICFRRFRCLCVRLQSGLLLLDSALFHVDGTLCPECVRTFRNPNECCFLRYAASVCCVAQTAPTGPRRSHL